MKESSSSCQHSYFYLKRVTVPDSRSVLLLHRLWWKLKNLVLYVSVLGPVLFVTRILPSTKAGRRVFKRDRVDRSFKNAESLDLKPGEWVAVKSAEEILSTLDADLKYKGLSFDPEMLRFCGRRFRVYKRVNRIIVESTGQVREMRSPTVLLEGTVCNGQAHGGCDRSCFCFWREVWLRRV